MPTSLTRTRRLLSLAALLLAAGAARAQQPLPPIAPQALDTVAVRGTVRVLTLAPDTGENLPMRSLWPSRQTAILYRPPAGAHEYDLDAVRLLVSDQVNRSNTGQVRLQLVRPDSASGAPTGRPLLPAPLVFTARQARRARHGVVSLDLRPYRLTLPPTGCFVVLAGEPDPGYTYLGDTLLLHDKRLGLRAVYAKLAGAAPAGPARLHLVNATDFVCVREVRTTTEPQTWDYSPAKGTWVRRKGAYPGCPRCVISNAGVELVVREL